MGIMRGGKADWTEAEIEEFEKHLGMKSRNVAFRWQIRHGWDNGIEAYYEEKNRKAQESAEVLKTPGESDAHTGAD
jgi:hypothetical protein